MGGGGGLVCEDGLLKTAQGGERVVGGQRSEIPVMLGGESMKLQPLWMRLL